MDGGDKPFPKTQHNPCRWSVLRRQAWLTILSAQAVLSDAALRSGRGSYLQYREAPNGPGWHPQWKPSSSCQLGGRHQRISAQEHSTLLDSSPQSHQKHQSKECLRHFYGQESPDMITRSNMVWWIHKQTLEKWPQVELGGQCRICTSVLGSSWGQGTWCGLSFCKCFALIG